MADAGWVDVGCVSEFEAGQLGLSEYERSLDGSVDTRSVADADQHQISFTAIAAFPAISKASEVEDSAAAIQVPPPSAEEYSCPICLELLLRPISLSCSHRLCRGCWARVLQDRTAFLTRNTTCPLGRCPVGPTVPTVDVALMSELESRFGPQLIARAAEHPLADEERMVNEVNAKVAAGYKPGTSEVTEERLDSPREERGDDANAVLAPWVAQALVVIVVLVITSLFLLSGFGCLTAFETGKE